MDNWIAHTWVLHLGGLGIFLFGLAAAGAAGDAYGQERGDADFIDWIVVAWGDSITLETLLHLIRTKSKPTVHWGVQVAAIAGPLLSAVSSAPSVAEASGLANFRWRQFDDLYIQRLDGGVATLLGCSLPGLLLGGLVFWYAYQRSRGRVFDARRMEFTPENN